MSRRQAHRQRDGDGPESAPTSAADSDSRQDKDSEIDALIDEIDSIIEETGVTEYIQKGGQ
ncbi:ubiquitin-like protein Pup [Lentzea sp. NPDC004782]|uniref:ubiquitin-like protein Pup n=1 Tax=Lentzea sp. NPDC004782 TaxID=3154458 RepID=UPI0033BEF466